MTLAWCGMPSKPEALRIPYAHRRCGSVLLMATKKAVNVSVQTKLMEAARAEDINLPATLEAALTDQLRNPRRDRWRNENAVAIEAYNRDVDANGSFGDHSRGL
jgi:antitoxin CcdA